MLLIVGHLAGELFNYLADNLVLHRFSPDGQLARLTVGNHPDAGHLRAHGGQHRLGPFLLDRRDGINYQLVLPISGRGLLDPIDGRLDGLVVGGWGHHHQVPAAGVQRHPGTRRQLLQSGDQTRRRRHGQRIQSQLGIIGPGLPRLQLLQRRPNRLLLGGNGQRYQAAGLRIDGQLGIRQQTLQQG